MENFGSFIYNKCLDFAIRITKLYIFLTEEKKRTYYRNRFFEVGPVLELIWQKPNTEQAKKTF